MQLILLINVKMPTIVGILTVISRINTKSRRSKQENYLIFSMLDFIRGLHFMLSRELDMTNSGPGKFQLKEIEQNVKYILFMWRPPLYRSVYLNISYSSAKVYVVCAQRNGFNETVL